MSSLILLKPDAFERALTVDLMFRLRAIGTIVRTNYIPALTRQELDQLYVEHIEKPFYPGIIEAMEGKESLAIEIYGDTINIRDKCLLIRSHYVEPGYVGPRNIIHSSDSAKAAERELGIWFS